ncbi:trypsin alpha-like [Cloeon dipterum]|uniref:trypsin alpha-like n=1 Tax=Cloeon dipterum TaxID=197152 RepID=UPI00322059B0
MKMPAWSILVVLLISHFNVFAIPERPKLESRILGGSSATISQVPYQLSLRDNGSHFCGAAILNSEYALTAAHCIDPSIELSRVQVVSGATFLNAGGSVSAIQSVEVHPNYNRKTMDYDIAVIKVRQPFTMSASVAPIALPRAGLVASPGADAVISGWGVSTAGEDEDIPNELQRAKISISNFRRCKLQYLFRARVRITERMICAGTSNTISSCPGDSGGALVVNNVEVGITSFGPGPCGSSQLPGVYTNVADPELRQWISSKTNGL